MSNGETPISVKAEILSDLWIGYRDDENFEDFIDYNDIGLPLSFLISEDLVTPNEKCLPLIEETFRLFVESLGIEKDVGFESLDEMLGVEE